MSFFDKTEIANQKYIEEKVYSFVLPEMRRFKYYSVVRVHSGMQDVLVDKQKYCCRNSPVRDCELIFLCFRPSSIVHNTAK